MTCFHPITVWKNNLSRLDTSSNCYYKSKKISFKEKKYWQKIEIPCGHCLGCRLDHANEWATRLTIEANQWNSNYFVTLTYNSNFLPSRNNLPTLQKKDLQDFMKRLRYYKKGEKTNNNNQNQIRYFACGEYGPKRGRPHYHLALFNLKIDDLKFYKLNKHEQPMYKSQELQKIWGKGFVVVEPLCYENAAYIARYVQKKAGILPTKTKLSGKIREELRVDERNNKFYTHIINERKKETTIIEKEFIIMSRRPGLGNDYWENEKEKIKRNSGIFIKTDKGVKLKNIPRYFKKKWNTENWEEFEKWKFKKKIEMNSKRMEIIKKINLNGKNDEEKYDFYLKTQEKILTEKAKFLKRNEFI